MKRLSIVIIVILLFSCKKDSDIDTGDLRLIDINSVISASVTVNMHFDYDANGRIIKITSSFPGSPTTTIFDISYSGNQVLLARPAFNSTGVIHTDSTWLTLRSDGQPEKKILYRFYETFGPGSNPQRTYTYDTTNYSYDGTGLLTRTTYGSHDSTWYDPGTVTTYSARRNNVSIYTNSNDNLTSISHSGTLLYVTRFTSTTITTFRTNEGTDVFEYTKNSPNKTDFKNSAVLNELNLFLIPMNPNYKNLPNKKNINSVTKDDTGNIIDTNATWVEQSYTYSFNGFLKSKFLPTGPNERETFVYNR